MVIAITSARHAPSYRVGCPAGTDDDARTAPLGVVQIRAEVLRSHVHMNHDYLRPAGHHEVAVGSGHGHGFVETKNQVRRPRPALNLAIDSRIGAVSVPGLMKI